MWEIIRKLHIEILLVPFTYISAFILKKIRQHQHELPINWEVLKKKEVIPIINTYYEPIISPKQLKYPLGNDRKIGGIDFQPEIQLEWLRKFEYSTELLYLEKLEMGQNIKYSFKNSTFGPGDAEYLYSLVRYIKPKRIIEIGSGESTKVSVLASRKNREEGYPCEIFCIEPYEDLWLEQIQDITIIRKCVEDIEISFFERLEENDILFIDSSHVIRPQGDILYEYQNIIPVLSAGVYIHVHDIFTPKDYPANWLFDEVYFWNEQYFVEAFLAYNDSVKIIGALNYLCHNYREELGKAFPIFKNRADAEPGSLWLRKIN